MKRYLFVVMLILFAAILLVGCKNNREAGLKNSANAISTPVDSANTSNTAVLNENTPDLELKEKFLNSKEGHDFQVVSWKFTKAFLSGEVSTMKNFLAEPEKKGHYYSTENMFEGVEFLILKLSPKDIKAETVIAEYEFGLKGRDTLQYLYLEMKKVNNEWKVQNYGLEM